MRAASFWGMGLSAGQRAPDFSLMSIEGRPYTLNQFRGKTVLLYFYPRAHSYACSTQACSFRADYVQLKARFGAVLAISTDPISVLQSFGAKYSLPFTLLSDDRKKISQAYEVLNPLGRANRVTFLISPEGVILKNIKFLVWNNYVKALLKKLSQG
jgi:peroxiredoxin Q/BCP